MSTFQFERAPANLHNLPTEIVTKFIFPHVGAPELKSLVLVDRKLKDSVELFIQSFNENVILSKPCKLDLFNFMTDQTINLVKLDLGGCLNSPCDKQHPEDLKDVILRNKNLEEIFIPNTWVSAEVVQVLARNSPNLKVVQLSTFKIRLFDLSDEKGASRKLWPCSCWGTELEMEDEFEFGKYFLPDSLWGSKAGYEDNKTVERKLLNNLRMLRKNIDFQDFAWQSMIESKDKKLMDPLNYHEHKCRKGMFYDGNNDQDDLFLHQMAQFFDESDSDSDSDQDELY